MKRLDILLQELLPGPKKLDDLLKNTNCSLDDVNYLKSEGLINTVNSEFGLYSITVKGKILLEEGGFVSINLAQNLDKKVKVSSVIGAWSRLVASILALLTFAIMLLQTCYNNNNNSKGAAVIKLNAVFNLNVQQDTSIQVFVDTIIPFVESPKNSKF